MSTLKPTDEQQAVIDAARTSSDSLMIKADAGCAKSSTLKMLGQVIKGSVLGMAFNKSTAKEMADSMPGNFAWKTANGLGHGAWIRANPGVSKWTLDDRKLGKLISQSAKDHKITLSSDQWDEVRQLVQMAMLNGLTPDNVGRPLIQETPELWTEMAEDLFIAEEDRPLLIDLARGVLIESIRFARLGTISFDDQIYCSVCLNGRFAQYPDLMSDEAQDLNSLNHQMLRLSLRPDGRIICVGDPKQSIYAFRGAHTESMEQIRALRPKWQDLKLQTTFRCPKVVVARQQHHAPGFNAFHSNAEGKFTRFPEGIRFDDDGSDVQTWGWKDLQAETAGSLAILCRNNAPLMSMAFKLIRRRVGVKMLGRQLGKNLIAFSKKIVPKDETLADISTGMITEWREREIGLLKAQDKPHKIEAVEDQTECLLAVLGDAEARDAGQMRKLLEQLFSKEDGLVNLGSGHRAKGLEWDTVLHVDPWRLPSRQAREAQRLGDPRPMNQEMNLNYVIETRTKHTLINANLEDFS